jgi:hypothetical protein
VAIKNEQNSWDLGSAAKTARKTAEKLGYTKNHAVSNFLDFAEIMSEFVLTPIEAFDRWLQMVNSTNSDPISRLKPDALPEAETPESAGS